MTATTKHLTTPSALLALALLAAGAAHAAVSSVVASPRNAPVALTTATSVSVGWRATSTTGGTIDSAQGVFRTSTGVVLGNVGRRLNKSQSGPGAATFAETILVPSDVAYRAHRLGFTSFLYERSFNDGGGSASGALTVQITTAAVAGFGISRVALQFNDNKSLAMANRGDKLLLHAEVSFTGSGLLRGLWELAGPNADTGNPQYRVLASVNQMMVGADKLTLTSPALPTDITGTYLVRLHIVDPASAFELAAVRYFVSEKPN